MSVIHGILRDIGDKKRHLEKSAHTSVTDLVSVCMPNHNKGPYIYDAIRSIAEQKLSHVELCIVDDCSTDNSRDEIDRALSDFSLMHRKLYLPKRVGTAWAQNIAYYLADGMYLANMDSDDISALVRLQTQKDYLEEHDLDFVGSNFSIFRDDINCPSLNDGGIWLKYKKEQITKSYLDNNINCVCFGTGFFKKKVLEITGGLDKSFIGTEDYGFLYKIVKKGLKVGNVNKILYFYRRCEGQRSSLFHASL